MKKDTVTPTEEERKMLGELSDKGEHKSRKIQDTLPPLCCDHGELRQEGSTDKGMSPTRTRMIDRLKSRFIKEFRELSSILSRINWL